MAEVRSDEDVRLLQEELLDRYGDPPPPVAQPALGRQLPGPRPRAGISEVTAQGKYVRFHPVELPDSRVVRLNRLYPKSLYKAPVRTMLVPRPQPAGFGAAGSSGRGAARLGAAGDRRRDPASDAGKCAEERE